MNNSVIACGRLSGLWIILCVKQHTLQRRTLGSDCQIELMLSASRCEMIGLMIAFCWVIED